LGGCAREPLPKNSYRTMVERVERVRPHRPRTGASRHIMFPLTEPTVLPTKALSPGRAEYR